MASKEAICCSKVPACLSPTNQAIEIGDKVSYLKISFRNGESHLVLSGGSTVPSVFFTI